MILIFAFALYYRSKTASDYYVASSNISTFTNTASYLSTNIGGGTLITLVAIAYSGGFAALYLGISYALGLILLSFLVKKIKTIAQKNNLVSLSDFSYFFYKSKRLNILIAAVNFVAFFLLLSAQFLALSFFVESYTSLTKEQAIVLVSVFLTTYSLFGGLKVDIKTDVIQFFLMVVTLTVILFVVNNIGLGVNLNQLDISYITGFAYGGYAYMLVLIFFLCPSVMVGMDTWQRVLASKNSTSGIRSLVYAGLGITVLFAVFTYLGILSYQINSNVPNNQAFIQILEYLPQYITPFVLLLVFVSITSTADSMLVTASTSLLKNTIMEKVSNNIIYIKITTVIVALVATIITLLAEDIVKIVVNAFSSLAILFPAIILPFYGVLNEKASFYSVLFGFISAITLVFFFSDVSFVIGVLTTYGLYIVIFLFDKYLDARIKQS